VINYGGQLKFASYTRRVDIDKIVNHLTDNIKYYISIHLEKKYRLCMLYTYIINLQYYLISKFSNFEPIYNYMLLNLNLSNILKYALLYLITTKYPKSKDRFE